jgi:glucose-specific phosphotransferase system IIA component
MRVRKLLVQVSGTDFYAQYKEYRGIFMNRLFTLLQNMGKSLARPAAEAEKKEKIIKKTEKPFVAGTHSLYNPIEGEIVALEKVPEGAFSGKVLGDGFAVIPTGNKVYSPADGEVVVLFPTKHAVVILTEEGLEVLIHIGINTVNLNGEGFTVHVEKGSKVKKGDLLITFDAEIVKQKGKSLVSPVVITNTDVVNKLSVDIGNKKALEKAAEVTIG